MNDLIEKVAKLIKEADYDPEPVEEKWELDLAKKIHQLYLSDPSICEIDTDRPKIICLCGSTRFTGEMLVKQWELTKQGNVVLSWCALPDNYFQGEDKAHIGDQEGVKKIVDEVHLRKIDLADEVFVINIKGYIGESTANEIAYAESKGKTITYKE
jgi:hypothetical protein